MRTRLKGHPKGTQIGWFWVECKWLVVYAPQEKIFSPTEVLLIKSQSDEARKLFAHQMCAMVEPIMHHIRDPDRYEYHSPSGSEKDFHLCLALTDCGTILKVSMDQLRAASIKRFGS